MQAATSEDYEDYAKELLPVFGEMQAANVTAPMLYRYLQTECASAPVRANREISLLGNLIDLAVQRGEAESNPCRGRTVKRNKETPSTVLPRKVRSRPSLILRKRRMPQ